jgi:hypothetical protein
MAWQAMPIATQWSVTEPTLEQRNVHQLDFERAEAAVRAGHDPWRVVPAQVYSNEPDPPAIISGKRKSVSQAQRVEGMDGWHHAPILLMCCISVSHAAQSLNKSCPSVIVQ